MTAEEFIKDCTRHCANDIVGWDKNGLPLYHEWLTPDQALRAVEMAREEVREQMLAQTVEGKIYETQARSKRKATTTGYISHLDYNVGDKVKLIIIKED